MVLVKICKLLIRRSSDRRFRPILAPKSRFSAACEALKGRTIEYAPIYEVEPDERYVRDWGRFRSPFQGSSSQGRLGSLGVAQGCDRAALRASKSAGCETAIIMA